MGGVANAARFGSFEAFKAIYKGGIRLRVRGVAEGQLSLLLLNPIRQHSRQAVHRPQNCVERRIATLLDRLSAGR